MCLQKIMLTILLAVIYGNVLSQRGEIERKGNLIIISKEKLKDKIKGAWVAQTIGVTFGAPIEFRYNSTLVRNNQPVTWSDSSMFVEFRDRPGTYDDIYMDLTFMKVIQEEGIDAPAQSFAESFAHADYKLWFANQTARYNILNGLKPPESGYWLNNPCADDIDFQIEADFAGLMSAGMTNSAVEICDKVGHIMNYGDGWYGGVFVASLYSLALITEDVNDMENIIQEALNVIPPESKFYQCIHDVIEWHREDPVDWQATWFRTFRKWGVDTGSPLGIFRPFNIDAKINAAWVVIGLLYGNGDFTRTLQIAVRCGDDADCNPATAGGILAAIKGFESIPEYWKSGLEKVESLPFMGTDISLKDAYDMSYRFTEEMISRNGGDIGEHTLTVKLQKPVTVPLEVSFKGHYPIGKVMPVRVNNEITWEFDGIGFALVAPPDGRDYGSRNHVFKTQMYIDGRQVETADLPTKINERRFTPFWRYQLPDGHHKVVIKILNPVDYAQIEYLYAIIYGDKPYEIKF